MRLLYRFLSNFLCTCMLVSSAVLVCCMDMQDRVWLSVSDNLRPRAVPWMCGASRGVHARTRAAARRPSGFIAKAACNVNGSDSGGRSWAAGPFLLRSGRGADCRDAGTWVRYGESGFESSG